LVGKPEGKSHLGDQEVEGRILKYILKKWIVRMCYGLIWLRIGLQWWVVSNPVMKLLVP
jgi:hypothetical protein